MSLGDCRAVSPGVLGLALVSNSFTHPWSPQSGLMPAVTYCQSWMNALKADLQKVFYTAVGARFLNRFDQVLEHP